MDTTPPIGPTELPGKGRAIISLRPIKGGEIILRDTPLILYSAQPFNPNTPLNQNNYCSHCFKTISKHPQQTQTSCSTCGSHFCSLNCQHISSTSSHTPYICQTLSHLQHYFSNNINVPLELHSQARYLVSAYNLAVVSPEKFQKLLSLQGGELGCESDEESAKFLFSIVRPPVGDLGFSVELVRALLGKDKVNAFGLMEPFNESGERSVRAYGIYGTASLFNHDCLPNACRFDYVDGGGGGLGSGDNTEIMIRMIHEVPQGMEICLSYFPVNLRYSERQKRLKDDYGFVCECDRCKVEVNWENCGGTLAPLPPSAATSNGVMECHVCGSFKKPDQMGNLSATTLKFFGKIKGMLISNLLTHYLAKYN
ncbi:ASH1-related protein 2 [Artemisia annua]|uniref:ASH1-related protein 2 n=1 Tax=Artemisia annua TaxID=35608 RepID=A0A2U1PMQ2_ARTAN|nr:ASH1-related protein 2 [Artemisia annua]